MPLETTLRMSSFAANLSLQMMKMYHYFLKSKILQLSNNRPIRLYTCKPMYYTCPGLSYDVSSP